MFRPLSKFNEDTRLSTSDTLRAGGKGGFLTGSGRFATIVIPRSRLESLLVALGTSVSFGMVVRKQGTISS